MTEAEEVNLGELLAALTVEVRGLAVQFKRSRVARIAQWVLSIGLVLAIAVSGYAIVGNRDVAHCLNNKLGQRQKPSAQLTNAQLIYATAQLKYAQAESRSTRAQNASSGALFALLKAPKADQAADYEKFLASFANGQAVAAQTQTALDSYVAATAIYVAALGAVQTAQTNNPLGKC